MSKNKKEFICDVCGHYWHPASNNPDVCALCGTGDKVELGSDDDPNKDKR